MSVTIIHECFVLSLVEIEPVSLILKFRYVCKLFLSLLRKAMALRLNKLKFSLPNYALCLFG